MRQTLNTDGHFSIDATGPPRIQFSGLFDMNTDHISAAERDDIPQLFPVPLAEDWPSFQPPTDTSPPNKLPTMKKRKRVIEGEDIDLTKQTSVISSEISTPHSLPVSSSTQEGLPETTNPDVTLTKRKKSGFTQHPSHWIPEGNILIQIEDVRFKLLRSRLAKYSGYFRDLPTIKTEEGVGEYGVVTLDETGIKLKDFVVLLDALDTFMPGDRYVHPTFNTISSILRASRTLSFERSEKWAIQCLKNAWSESLDNLSPTRIPFAHETIVLARDYKIPSILKRSMYELLRFPEFGSEQTDQSHSQVSITDLRLLIKSRAKLISMWNENTTSTFANCQSNNKNCPARGKFSHMKLVQTSQISIEFMYDPICGLQALINAPWREVGFCEKCIAAQKLVWGTARKKAWEDLNDWLEI